MARQEANWIEIDITTLQDDQLKAYDTYKMIYRDMKAARERFEQLMSRDVPEGERMIFGYNFGKLSVAIVPDDRAPKKAKASPQSLADYLASRHGSGHSC